ncbi:MAG: hypothetical protein R3246_09815 [Acidimicrobiia bacterium]|nr:hypothetical protein [Acidimicrobiia bacterium]
MSDVRRAARQAEQLARVQFQWSHPELEALFAELGIEPNRGYFAVRAAPMGRPNPVLVGSAFAFFPEVMVAKIVGRIWEGVEPDHILRVAIPRLAAAAASVYPSGPDLELLVPRYERAAAAAPPAGRSLTAAWSSVEWPEEAAARLLGAATILREYRGDAHILALSSKELLPLAGHLLAAGMRDEDPIDAFARGRGYRDGDVAPVVADLERRGAIADGALTSIGRDLWESVESLTDHLGAAPWRALGDELTFTTQIAAKLLEKCSW